MDHSAICMMRQRWNRQEKQGGVHMISRFHKCERCPALVGLKAKRCGPCQDDVRREAHRAHEKRRHEKNKMAKSRS